MTPQITVDASRWRGSAFALAKATGIDTQPIIREEARQFLRDVIRKTPPKTLAQGRAAIAGDFHRAIAPIREEKIRDESLKRAVQGNDLTATQAVFDTFPASGGRKFSRLFAKRRIVGAGQIRGIHKGARNKRGRVRMDQMNATIDARAHARQLKETQSRVGILKAGFNPAAKALGVKSPSWIARHGDRWGSVVDAINTDNPEITITNRGVKYPGYVRTVRDALKSRERAMETKIRRAMEGKAVNLGFANLLPR